LAAAAVVDEWEVAEAAFEVDAVAVVGVDCEKLENSAVVLAMVWIAS